MTTDLSELPARVTAPSALHILLVDDDPIQLKLSTLLLRDAGFEVTTASNAHAALEAARTHVPDAILSDVLIGEIDGFGLCRRLRSDPALAEVPILLVSSHYGDSGALELAVQVGASALIERTPDFQSELKSLVEALGRAPRKSRPTSAPVYEAHLRTNANQMTKLLDVARSATERYRALFEHASDTISILDRSGVVLEANERWRQVLGVAPQELVGKAMFSWVLHSEPSTSAELLGIIARGSGRLSAIPARRPDGVTAYLDFSINLVELPEGPVVLAIGRDVTGRFLAAQALGAAEEKYRLLVERLPDVVWTTSNDRYIFVTSNVERVTGFSLAELYASEASLWAERVHPDDYQKYQLALGAAAERFDVEYRWRRKDGRWVWFWHRIITRYERGGSAYSDALLSDVTQRHQLEDSLRQAQKMEAIGQLTGGIAHDFNNLLATVLANSQFLIDALDARDPRIADAQDIKRAAERGAALTRQLLAFSRKQVLEPRLLDLNRIVGELERMLRRLIREDIELNVILSPELASVRVDRGQLEQVVINLALNARDAMPNGGTLTLETMNVELDASYETVHAHGRPGSYVVLAVTDSGTGMDAETQRRVFEPFFTTKAAGQGTGLGLATCHGIVTQSGGHIHVYSELGHGTSFKVYLPCVAGEAEQRPASDAPEQPSRGELIVLVEDDAPLRTAVERMLLARGYRVLVARDCAEALAHARAHNDQIALLLSDVVMPHSSGPDVAAAVRAIVPSIRVLFMSGYSDHAMLSSGVLPESVHFIQKPFSPHGLARKLREVLEPGTSATAVRDEPTA